MTYTALKNEIIDRSHRSDLSSVITVLIENAESYLFRELSLVELEQEATGTTTDSEITLPTDFMAVQRLEINDLTLDYGNKEGYETTATYPLEYTVEAGKIKIVDPVLDGTAYTLYYTAKLAALSESNQTNWLLENGKDAYIAAIMAEVGRHTKNANLIAENTAILPSLLESVRAYSQRKKYPVRAKLQIKPRR
jgi:hypothetical protein